MHTVLPVCPAFDGCILPISCSHRLCSCLSPSLECLPCSSWMRLLESLNASHQYRTALHLSRNCNHAQLQSTRLDRLMEVSNIMLWCAFTISCYNNPSAFSCLIASLRAIFWGSVSGFADKPIVSIAVAVSMVKYLHTCLY